MFGSKHWESAEGIVIDSQLAGGKFSSNTSVREFVIEVRTQSGEVFRAKVGQPRNSIDFWAPRIGQVVKVEYVADDHSVRFDKSDPAISAKAQMQAKTSSFDAALSAPAGTSAVHTAAVPQMAQLAPIVIGPGAGNMAPEQLQAMIAAAMQNAMKAAGAVPQQ
jgi:hypothetical protein